ncbi:MAG: cupin domain-containing protein [Planctomycetota bacterium]|jgi:D-lyxose ketol-isomerase
MSEAKTIDRRNLLKAAGAAAGIAALGAGASAHAAAGRPKRKSALSFKNEDFYGADGEFLEEKGKDAIIALCRHHGYHLFRGFRKGLWVSDYGKGQFVTMGLAAYFFVNNVEDRYMMLDLFLLPNQMLPEHWHVEGEDNPVKLEGWLVRWGLSHIVGIGEPNLSPEVVVPKCHWEGKVTTKHEVIAKPGTFVKLAKVQSPHWQFGGPEGCIVTEVANVHTGSAVRHSDPEINKFFLES